MIEEMPTLRAEAISAGRPANRVKPSSESLNSDEVLYDVPLSSPETVLTIGVPVFDGGPRSPIAVHGKPKKWTLCDWDRQTSDDNNQLAKWKGTGRKCFSRSLALQQDKSLTNERIAAVRSLNIRSCAR